MGGGLMNIVYTGIQNDMLTDNPKISYFKIRYAKYTNFGLQKFRIDCDGTKTLRMTDESTMTFKIPRYGDLLVDSFISIQLPNIWSPIYPPKLRAENDEGKTYSPWVPYEFRWIENLGVKMISKISIVCGNFTLQEYSGDYLLSVAQRDYDSRRFERFAAMIGGGKRMTDPANHGNNNGNYPNAYVIPGDAGPQPSILENTIYVPINAWYCLDTRQAFPISALQNNELKIIVTFKPVRELFQIRDVEDYQNNYPLKAPDFNQEYMQFYRFIHPPPSASLNAVDYEDQRTEWNADIHIVATYAFLTDCEKDIFVKESQQYIYRQVRERVFYNVTGTGRIELPDSHGLVTSYMLYFRRSDANIRNEWSNYTNFDYSGKMPSPPYFGPEEGTYITEEGPIGPGRNPDGSSTGLVITGEYTPENDENILQSMAIYLDGNERESNHPSGIYEKLEKFMYSDGAPSRGLYCYNFCLKTSPFIINPTGAINMSMVDKVEFEYTASIPPTDPMAQSMLICDPDTSEIVGVNKPSWRIYKYTYDLYIFEERINFLEFTGGNCGMRWSS
tara:strand:- start:569 stop:2245 length:1677 start_codon:yes stop_codon:yes gene_type:complete